jgi:hypothetical protein
MHGLTTRALGPWALAAYLTGMRFPDYLVPSSFDITHESMRLLTDAPGNHYTSAASTGAAFM